MISILISDFLKAFTISAYASEPSSAGTHRLVPATSMEKGLAPAQSRTRNTSMPGAPLLAIRAGGAPLGSSSRHLLDDCKTIALLSSAMLYSAGG